MLPPESFRQLNNYALTEGWLPLYGICAEALAKADPVRFLEWHFLSLIEADVGDPRLVYAVSALAQAVSSESNTESVRSHLTEYLERRVRDPNVARVAAHAAQEGLVQMKGHPLVAFFSGRLVPPLQGLSYRFNHGMAATGEAVKQGGRSGEESLTEMIELLSPYADGGLTTYLDLPTQSAYFKTYRFLSEELVRGRSS